MGFNSAIMLYQGAFGGIDDSNLHSNDSNMTIDYSFGVINSAY